MWKLLFFLCLLPLCTYADIRCFSGYGNILQQTVTVVGPVGYCTSYMECDQDLVNGLCPGRSVVRYDGVQSLSLIDNNRCYNIRYCNDTDYCMSPNHNHCYYDTLFEGLLQNPKQVVNPYNNTCYVYKDVCRYVTGDCTQYNIDRKTTVYVYGMGSCDDLYTNPNITQLKCCRGHLCNTAIFPSTSVKSSRFTSSTGRTLSSLILPVIAFIAYTFYVLYLEDNPYNPVIPRALA